MLDDAQFLAEDAPRVATTLATHLTPSQEFGAGLILVAILITLLIFALDMFAPERGPRR